jgi:hypothetical protein
MQDAGCGNGKGVTNDHKDLRITENYNTAHIGHGKDVSWGKIPRIKILTF